MLSYVRCKGVKCNANLDQMAKQATSSSGIFTTKLCCKDYYTIIKEN